MTKQQNELPATSIIKTYKKHNKCKNLYVKDEYLLYYIADKGLLHTHLRGVYQSKDDPQKFIWYFKKDVEIKKIIDEFENKVD